MIAPRIGRWQVKVLGYYWYFAFASWAEWHDKDADRRMRRAWWWLWHWRGSKGRSCIRVCGVTLHSKSTPAMDY